jgi:glutamine amidotransferase
MTKKTVMVLDYAIARTRRLLAALTAIGVEAKLTECPRDARHADVLLVPDGDDADVALERGLSSSVLDAIAAHADDKRPLLCIGFSLCLLLEGPAHAAMPPGLGIFKAPVQRFDPRMTDEGERPLLSPHVGQSLVVGLDRHPLLGSLVPRGEAGVWLSFRHRLCAPSRIPQADVAVCHHGVPFAGAVWRERTLAVQFIPEHSGKLGLDLLRTFVGAAT